MMMNGAQEDAGMADRREMLDQLRRSGVTDPAILRAFASVPRDHFLEGGAKAAAYENRALPIRYGQTISQPTMIAEMLALAQVREGTRVLDVGTGSGYQAALLSVLGADVTTIEIIDDLAQSASLRLERLGFHVVSVVGDGSLGYPLRAPYDVIMVAAASPAVPPPLVEQLAEGGRLILPLSHRDDDDADLALCRRSGDSVTTTLHGLCKFVPLTGRYGHGPDEDRDHSGGSAGQR